VNIENESEQTKLSHKSKIFYYAEDAHEFLIQNQILPRISCTACEVIIRGRLYNTKNKEFIMLRCGGCNKRERLMSHYILKILRYNYQSFFLLFMNIFRV
jgi:hypothetical protein